MANMLVKCPECSKKFNAPFKTQQFTYCPECRIKLNVIFDLKNQHITAIPIDPGSSTIQTPQPMM